MNLANLNPQESLWLLWFLIFFLFVVISIIFTYQWRHYGVQNSDLRFGEFTYYILSIFMLGFSALSILLFTANL